MEEKKKKSVASIPDNYVSILQLQERWLKEKERKQKQKLLTERGVKQQEVDHGQRKREEKDVMKVVKPEEKGLGMHCVVIPSKKEPNCVKKEENKVSAIVIKRDGDGDGGGLTEKKKNYPVKNDTKRVSTSEGYNAAKEETKFQDRWIKKRVEDEGETREVKGAATLNSELGYYRNQRHHDWSSTRVIKATTRTMVWVKKGRSNDASGENSNV